MYKVGPAELHMQVRMLHKQRRMEEVTKTVVVCLSLIRFLEVYIGYDTYN